MCKYCVRGFGRVVPFYNIEGIQIYADNVNIDSIQDCRYKNPNLTLDCDDCFYSGKQRINFCPMCGQKLD